VNGRDATLSNGLECRKVKGEGTETTETVLEQEKPMSIHSDSSLVPDVLPGLAHRTLAGSTHGLRKLAVWAQRIDAQGATPPHTHDCEEVILIQDGEGILVYEGQEHPFTAGDTIIVPPTVEHQLINTGHEPLTLVAILSTSNVEVKLPDGTPLDLPWD
jgi:mannose-6-phosphate isomerase-like protein (cupin superfamily)